MALINLHDFIEKTIAEFNVNFFSQDRKLPEAFKTYVKSNTGGEKYSFLDYTTVVRSDLNIYCPNQWFYIAAYYCKLYPVLQQYKDLVYSSAQLPDSLKDYQKFFADLLGDKRKALEVLTKGNLENDDKELLAMFMSDLQWWRGGKGIERNDFYYSPILSAAALVNQSQSYVAEICKYLVENPIAWEILLGEIQGKSIVIEAHTIYESTVFVEFMEECMRVFLQYDINLSKVPFKKNTVTIGFKGCQIGKKLSEFEKVIDDRRKDDCNKDIQWEYNKEIYCFWKEQSKDSFDVFKANFNSIYRDKYEIIDDGITYKLVEHTTVSYAVSAIKIPSVYQVIYYGAPGTGKSRKIKNLIAENHIPVGTNVFRTTFHPDTDYASFVGCYKPTERGGILTQTVWDFASKSAVEIPVKDVNGKPVIDRSITYRYVPQVFVNAYVRAWNLMGKIAAPAIGTAAGSTITIPSFSPSSCYAGKCSKGISGAFTCDAGIEKLDNNECEALAEVEAFNFPFEDYSSIGDLRNKKGIKVVVADAPTPQQIASMSREVTYKKEDVKAEINRLNELREKRLINDNKYGYDVIDSTIERLEEIRTEIGEKDEITRIETRSQLNMLGLLGLYDKKENTVYLFKNNIGNNIALLVGTYIHEMFHAYFSEQNYVPEIEECIVECATLCFLEQLNDMYKRTYCEKVVGMCGTAASYYGFGIELYERCSEDWIDDYFHAPRIDVNDPRVKELCGSFRLGYPFGRDEELVKKLYIILKEAFAKGSADKRAISNNEAVVLVIEEINRGNCAQIFGDLFQLLDRKNGFSEYPIKAEEDLRTYLESAKDGDGNDILTNKEGIKDGMLCLPPNLYIWATMNTSDQSLFPIDSAFKRRWDMEYEPINYDDAKQFTLELDKDHRYNWAEVLQGLNDYIKQEKTSTNKLLGNRFVKPNDDSVIDAKSFINKVLFFVFNDVFKDDDDFRETFFDGFEKLSFFEDLCESSDNSAIITFVEKICKAKNLVKPATPATTEDPVEATE